MRTVLLRNLRNRAAANTDSRTPRRLPMSCFGLLFSPITRRAGHRRQPRCAVRPPGGGRQIGAILVAAASILVVVATASAQTSVPYDAPVTTLVTNMLQPSGSSMVKGLSAHLDGLFVEFRTGPNADGYQLSSILLYVRDTHESRYMTILGRLWERGDNTTWVADLTHEGSLDDFAHNEWEAPPNTYLKPNTTYRFALDCVIGCANDNKAQFGYTSSKDEDSGAEAGWRIQDFLGFRKTENGLLYSDWSKVLRVRIKGRASPHRAYRTEIVSVPRDGHTYRQGENINIALTFNTPVYVDPASDPAIGLRMGDGAGGGSNYRAAAYLSGSQTNRLLYRYQVQIDDVDSNGISIEAGGEDTGYSGWVPRIVYSLGILPVDRHFPGITNAGRHKVDGSLRVTDVAITSAPIDGHGYRLGDDIDVTLTFSSEAYVSDEHSVVAIRVGSNGNNYRSASYASGSGTKWLVYRYRVQFNDYDANGISVDTGGPRSGFGGTLPTAGADPSSRPTSRNYAGISDHAGHKVSRSVRASFGAAASTASEDGTTATVTVELSADPERPLTIPIAAALGNGASADDYSLSAASLDFAPGDTAKSFTVTATDDSEDDDGETVELSFGTLPPGVLAGTLAAATVAIADDDGAATGQTVTISVGREAYIAALDDVIFNLTLAEPSDEAFTVNVRLTQNQAFLSAELLTQQVEFRAGTRAAELRMPAALQNQRVAQSGTLTANLIKGAGYHIEAPSTASARMLVSRPALIARLGETLYRFEEGGGGAAPRFEVIMETQPGFPAPNLGHEVTVATADDTADNSAEAGLDYTAVTATVTFAPQEFAAADGRWAARRWIEIPLVDDAADEAEETLLVTLTRDAGLSDLVQTRNPNRTECDGTCQARIVIVDNDMVGVAFLDGGGNPLADLRLEVREGERVTYQVRLDRRPAQWVALSWEPGSGDSALSPLGDQYWWFSPDEVPAASGSYHWQEAVPLTVEALQDNDPYPGERVFHHFLSTEDPDSDRVRLPDVVIVAIDNEADGPLRVFGTPEVVSRPASGGDTYGLGERIDFQVTFTRPVRVTGSPYLEFALGNPGATRQARANHTDGSATQDLLFSYTVGRDDWDDDGIEIGAGSIRLNDGTIQGVDNGEAAALDHAAAGAQTAHKIRGAAALSVADAQAAEAAGATLDFVVTLSRSLPDTVTVDYATADGTATAGEDYTAEEGTLAFEPGQTRKTVRVTVLDDDHDEGEETLTLTLRNASGAYVVDDSATGTIRNDDPLPQAWLARFGRTVAQHVLDGVQARLTEPRQAGSRVTVAGHAVDGAAEIAAANLGSPPVWASDGSPASDLRFGPQLLTTRDLLTRSAFTLSGEGNTSGMGAVWGRGAYSGFAANIDGLSLDGEVTTGMVGADYVVGRWIVGLSLAHSDGDGTWNSGEREQGGIASSLTGLYPYAGYNVTDWLSMWGVAGYGEGNLTLTPRDGASYLTDMRLTMAAVGVRGDLLSARQANGLALAFESDAMLVRTTSDPVSGESGLLGAAQADVNRLRLALEGSVEFLLAGGGFLAPSLELGLRHDGGDAETGFGVELGGGFSFADATGHWSAEVMVRGLLAHEASDFRDWGLSGSLRFDPRPNTDRGLSASLTPSWGSSDSVGVSGLMGRDTLTGLVSHDMTTPGGRVDAEAAYGLAMLGGRATGMPYLGVGLSEEVREVRVGYRLGLLRREGLKLGIEGTQRESTVGGKTPEHGVMLRLALQGH